MCAQTCSRLSAPDAKRVKYSERRKGLCASNSAVNASNQFSVVITGRHDTPETSGLEGLRCATSGHSAALRTCRNCSRHRPAGGMRTTACRDRAFPAGCSHRLRGDGARVLVRKPVPRPSRERAFTVQVGAFSAQERAVTLQRELGSAGAEANVRQAEVGGRTIYRVRVGRFASHAEAAVTARRLAARGYTVILMGE